QIHLHDAFTRTRAGAIAGRAGLAAPRRHDAADGRAGAAVRSCGELRARRARGQETRRCRGGLRDSKETKEYALELTSAPEKLSAPVVAVRNALVVVLVLTPEAEINSILRLLFTSSSERKPAGES